MSLATRFTRQATNLLAPGYNQQITAAQSTIPAIQKMFELLVQGLEGTQRVENQNILEDAAGRGLVRSTIPVDKQSTLAQSILQQQAQLSAKQAQDIGGVYQTVGGLQTNMAQDIAELASTLRQGYNSDQAIKLQQKQNNRMFNLQKKLGNKKYSLDLRAAQGGF